MSQSKCPTNVTHFQPCLAITFLLHPVKRWTNKRKKSSLFIELVTIFEKNADPVLEPSQSQHMFVYHQGHGVMRPLLG